MGFRAKKWEGEEAKEYKVIKLPRNGPAEGQSMGSWLSKKRIGDLTWEKRRRRAIDEGML